jgi:outer membrane protein OmpA-like peptidoglycan-associated protein
MAGDLSGGSLGDLHLNGKVLALTPGPFRLALAGALTFPTSDQMNFAGSKTVTFTPRVIFEFERGRVRAAINAGYLVRGRSTVDGLTVGNEFRVGAGASVNVVSRRVWLLGEGYLAGAAEGNGADTALPAEVLGGLRWAVYGPWNLFLGAGMGLTHGYGSPAARGLASFGYAPLPPTPVTRIEVAEPPLPPPLAPGIADSDNDGYPDIVDECPWEPEDFDGWQDEDGCPDPDNDGDKIPDALDDCPMEPEVINGVDDEDGCPDQGLFVMVENRIVLEERVLFDLMRARVKHAARPVLQAIVDLWKQHSDWDKMIIEGHADVRGTVEYNQWLSQKRADRVREYLIGLGMPPERVQAIGYGKSRPRDPGDSETAHQRNRRVEFVVVDHEAKSAPQRSNPRSLVDPAQPPAAKEPPSGAEPDR